MNIRGTRILGAPRDAVFAAICDPDTLLAVIPGCRPIEKVDDADAPHRGVLQGEAGSLIGQGLANLDVQLQRERSAVIAVDGHDSHEEATG